jgi:type IV pilus assembly protein PilN
MITTPYDLLREKRQALGLPEPADDARQTRDLLLKGAAIGAALLGLALGVAGLVILRRGMLTVEIDSITSVEADVERFETRLRTEQARLGTVQAANQALVQGLLSVRSGSAVLRDLQLRVPRGVQLTEVKQQDGGQGLLLKGIAVGRQPFALINALQLELKRSPLLDPNRVSLTKASRDKADAQPAVSGRDVAFEITTRFRPPIQPLAEKKILEQLGADGLARRLALLQREDLLP